MSRNGGASHSSSALPSFHPVNVDGMNIYLQYDRGGRERVGALSICWETYVEAFSSQYM